MAKINKIKKFLVIELLILILCMINCVFADGSMNKKVWMAGDTVFEPTSGTSMAGTIDGLTFNSGVVRYGSKKTYKGETLYNYFYMPNFGSTTYGSIKFDVNGDSDIYIIANSNSNGEERELGIYSTATQQEECIKINEPNGYKYEYKGGAGSIYVYAKAMPIRIYGLGFKKANYRDNTYSSIDSNFQDILANHSSSIINNEISNGIAFFADGTNNMRIEANATKDNSYKKYSHVLKMDGTGYIGKYRCVGIYPSAECDIYITARSEKQGENRRLAITNEFYETICDDIVVTSELKTYRIKYKGYDDCLFIKSLDNSIGIFNIQLIPKTNSNQKNCVWNFGTDGSFENQTITATKNIKGLTIYPNISSISISDLRYSDYYKALILPTLDTFNRTSNLSFFVPNSRTEDGNSSIRKIEVKARTDSSDVSLFLVNEAGYIYGVQQMIPSNDTYVFDYDGLGEKVYLYGISSTINNDIKIYRIITDTNEQLVNGSFKILKVAKDITYPLYLTVNNIKQVDTYTYEVKYDANMLEVVNVGFTEGSYDYGNNGINIVSNSNGLLKFTISSKGEDWSGLFTIINVKAKGDGYTNLYFNTDMEA